MTNLNFAERVGSLKASEIRELLKLTEQPDIISFAGGLPAPELFPIKELEEVSKRVLEEDGKAALQYSTTEGFNPLREIIVNERMAPAGVNVCKDNILLTNGSQQALEFSAKLFVNKGDVIICESPTYLGAINAFRAYQPNFVDIPMDDDGMIMEELEKALENNPKAKMIYTIPDFQNPTGKTMSVERRKKLVEIAEKFNIPVIEDNPYGELIFEGKRLPSVKSFDKSGHVIYLGTFSKTFCPGLRLGWICADKEILTKYIMIKQGADLQCNSMAQRQAALFMQTYNLDEHISKIKEVYKRRRDLMINAIETNFPEDVKYTTPKGGLFTWVELREDIDTKDVLSDAIKNKVAFVTGAAFFTSGNHKNCMRLNYSNMSDEKIVEGIKRLAEVIKKYYNN